VVAANTMQIGQCSFASLASAKTCRFGEGVLTRTVRLPRAMW
jgi:hypothetical protein